MSSLSEAAQKLRYIASSTVNYRMDPLSVTASIIAIVTLGYKVVESLHDITSEIGSAATEIRVYAGEIKSFCRLLQRVKEEISKPIKRPAPIQSLICDILDICDRIFEPLRQLQSTIGPYVKAWQDRNAGIGKLKLLAWKLHWVFASKEKFLFYRDALKGHHGVLDSIIVMMILQGGQTHDDEDLQNIKLDLKTTIQDIKDMLQESTADTRLRVDWNRPQDGQRLLLESTSPAFDGSHKPMKQIAYEQTDQDSESTTLTMFSRAPEPDHDCTVEDVEEIDQSLVRYLDFDSNETEMDLREDIRGLYRKVIKLGSAALNDSEDYARSGSGRRQVDDWLETSSNPRRPESSLATDSDHTAARETRPVPTYRRDSDNLLSTTVINKPSSGRDASTAESSRPPPASIASSEPSVGKFEGIARALVQQRKAEMRADERNQPTTLDPALEMEKRRIEEAEKQLEVDRTKPPVILKDPFGRTHSFPWHISKHWDSFEALLKQVVSDFTMLDRYLQSRRYDLVDENHEQIVISSWEDSIKPGMSLTVRMHDLGLTWGDGYKVEEFRRRVKQYWNRQNDLRAESEWINRIKEDSMAKSSPPRVEEEGKVSRHVSRFKFWER